MPGQPAARSTRTTAISWGFDDRVATGTEPGLSLPLVSVVVPVLHDPPGIQECLRALSRQTYPRERFEIIVADNGSTDGTRAVVDRFRGVMGSRLTVVVEDRVRTSYAARNCGVRAARGEILAFTDADCVPTPGWLEGGVRALQAGAEYAGGRIVVTYRGPRPNAYEYWDSATRFNQQAYVGRHYGATANLFVHASVLARHGGFRSELASGGDRELGVRLWKAGERLVYAPDAVVTHPARFTLRSVFRKSLRLARAQRRLHQLGVAKPWECGRKLMRSTWRCPVPRDWTGRPPLHVVIAARLLHHGNAWVLATVCITHGLRGWLRLGRPIRHSPPALSPGGGPPPGS